MAKVWKLLETAFQLINAGYSHQARIILEKIIYNNPHHIEAWEVYISTYDTRSDLENLKDVVDVLWKAQVQDKDFLMANRRYILGRINERIASL